MGNVYQTYFTSLLVDPGFHTQIGTFDEILHSGIEYGFPFYEDEILNETQDPRFQEAVKYRFVNSIIDT